MNMEVTITNGNPTIINVSGRLDTVNAGEFEKAIAPVLAGSMENVVINCPDFSYISSSGLRQFLALQKTANAKNGQLVIKGLKPEVKEVFDMTGFTSLFKFE